MPVCMLMDQYRMQDSTGAAVIYDISRYLLYNYKLHFRSLVICLQTWHSDQKVYATTQLSQSIKQSTVNTDAQNAAINEMDKNNGAPISSTMINMNVHSTQSTGMSQQSLKQHSVYSNGM